MPGFLALSSSVGWRSFGVRGTRPPPWLPSPREKETLRQELTLLAQILGDKGSSLPSDRENSALDRPGTTPHPTPDVEVPPKRCCW